MTPVRAQIELPLDPSGAFAGVVAELGAAGVTVAAAEPGERLQFEWSPAPWQELTTEVELRFEPIGNGTRVTVERRGFEALLDDGRDLADWFAGQVAAPLLGGGFGDWVTDRRARRPSGFTAREVYRDLLFHRPGFKVLLGMREALESGCSALAVDHSGQMVSVAGEQNRVSCSRAASEPDLINLATAFPGSGSRAGRVPA